MEKKSICCLTSNGSQGHDLELGTNCLGPFLLNHYLEPILRKTANASNTEGAVRVIWVASMLTVGTVPGGIIFDSKTGQPKVLSDAMKNYMQSKVGNVFLANESAKRLGKDGIICLVSLTQIDFAKRDFS
jgi:retinol dehydrogenase-12